MKETSAGRPRERKRAKALASLANIMLARITHIARSRDVDRNERTRGYARLLCVVTQASREYLTHRFLSPFILYPRFKPHTYISARIPIDRRRRSRRFGFYIDFQVGRRTCRACYARLSR